jgi:hypothetical protein
MGQEDIEQAVEKLLEHPETMSSWTPTDSFRILCRLFRKAVQ